MGIQSKPELAPLVVNFLIPDFTYPPAKALTEKRARGRLKSLNPEKGYGFIECFEIANIFGGDVFVHYKQAANFAVGSEVSFSVMLSKDNKPQAYDMQMAEDGFTTKDGKMGGG